MLPPHFHPSDPTCPTPPPFPRVGFANFSGSFPPNVFLSQGSMGRCFSAATPYFHNFTPASPHHPPSSCYLLSLLIGVLLSFPVKSFQLCSYLNFGGLCCIFVPFLFSLVLALVLPLKLPVLLPSTFFYIFKLLSWQSIMSKRKLTVL